MRSWFGNVQPGDSGPVHGKQQYTYTEFLYSMFFIRQAAKVRCEWNFGRGGPNVKGGHAVIFRISHASRLLTYKCQNTNDTMRRGFRRGAPGARPPVRPYMSFMSKDLKRSMRCSKVQPFKVDVCQMSTKCNFERLHILYALPFNSSKLL